LLKSIPRIRVLPVSAALSIALLGASMIGQVPIAQGAGAAGSDAREAVRLINGVRAAAGKSALKIDIYLADKATSGSITCPDDAAKSLSGRARDFAATGQMSHYLRKCDTSGYQLSSVQFVNRVQSWGYGAVGEIIGLNGGYGNGKLLYAYKGFSTLTYSTTGHILSGWMSSSSHAAIILGSYDRVGCGAWSPSGSTVYYDCVFSAGGSSPSGLAAPPTASPFGAAPPAPAPTPVRTAAPPAVHATPAPGGTGPTGQTGTSASPTSASTPTESPSASSTAAPSVAAVAAVWPSAEPSLAAAPGANTMTATRQLPNRDATLATESGLAILAGLAGLLLIFRRRRKVAGQVRD
jgi:uncharacterized protein YkwD